MFVFLNKKMQTYYNVKALSIFLYISAELNVIEQDPYYIISISFMFKKKGQYFTGYQLVISS